MEGTVARSYDVSHLTRACDSCGEFERHVNQRVIDQYEAFEADPPGALDWESLDQERKLVVAERVARHGRSVESLAPAEERSSADESSGERTPVDAAIAGESGDTTAAEDHEDVDEAAEEADAETDADADEEGAPEDDPAERDPDGDARGHDSTPSGSD